MIDTLRQTKKNMKLDIPFVLSFSPLSALSCSLLTPGESYFKTDRNKTLYSDHMGDPLNFCLCFGINLPRLGWLSIEHFWWLCNLQFPIKSLVFCGLLIINYMIHKLATVSFFEISTGRAEDFTGQCQMS